MSFPRYEIRSASDGSPYWRLMSVNGNVLITSETYSSKSACEGGIAASRRCAPSDSNYRRLTSTRGEPYFTLNAENYQVLGTSEMYSSTYNRDTGISATKRDGPTSNVVDLT